MITILSGPPASGKTVFIQHWIASCRVGADVAYSNIKPKPLTSFTFVYQIDTRTDKGFAVFLSRLPRGMAARDIYIFIDDFNRFYDDLSEYQKKTFEVWFSRYVNEPAHIVISEQIEMNLPLFVRCACTLKLSIPVGVS